MGSVTTKRSAVAFNRGKGWNMKKRTTILLASVMAAAFMQVGCGGGGQDADSPTESTVSSEETATPQN